jgi:hypothetical protein
VAPNPVSNYYDPFTGNRLNERDLNSGSHAYVLDAGGVWYVPSTDYRGRPTGDWAMADSSTQGLLNDRFFPEPSKPTRGFAPPSYSSTRQAQLESQAFTEEQNRLAREFQAEQDRIAEEARAEENRIAQEAALKRERLGVLETLIEGFMDRQQRATETLAALGPRPFRFAAAAQGMPVLGTTPQAGFEQTLQGFADRPVPSVDPNAPIGAIQGAIGGLMGQTVPLNPQVFGLAGGGTVPMGTSGTFLVGEKGPEVMDVTPYGVTVRPIQGGFQDGGTVQFDPQTVLQALLPLYRRLGFSEVPTNVRGHLNEYGTISGLTAERIQNLGYNPSFVRTSTPGSEPQYFLRGSDGTYREIGRGWIGSEGIPPVSSAFNLRSVDELAKLGPIGADLSTAEVPGFMRQFLNPQNLTDRPQLSAPLIDPTTGALLPAFYRIAPQIQRGLADPRTRFNSAFALKGYDNPLGGFPDIESLPQRTLTGPEFRPIGFR